MDTFKQQLEVLIKDLGIDNMPLDEQEKTVELISKRLRSVMINTLVSLMTAEQKKQFSDALLDDEKMDEKIAEIVADVPNADLMIQTAMEHEYKVIKEIINQPLV